MKKKIMSLAYFKLTITDELKRERAESERLVKILLEDLPDKNIDNPEACLYLPKNGYWSQTFEDVLEEAGYDVLMLNDKICILFSEETQEEMKEIMIEEAKLERDRKRTKF